MPLRRPALARAALAASLATLAACEPATDPALTRTFAVRTADGAPVPYTAACPAPAANAEAWVSFGTGTLTVREDGTFAWQFEIGSGYRSWTPGPNGERLNVVQSVQGGSRQIEGSSRLEADGAITLDYERAASEGTPLTGSGYVVRDSAFIREEMPCPQAPAGTAPHVFHVVLTETATPAAP